MTDPLEEQQEELRAIKRLELKIAGLRETNTKLINEIAMAGGSVDVSSARVEKLTTWLVEKNLITEKEKLEEQASWELHLRKQLLPVVDKARAYMKQHGQDAKTGSGIILPGHNGFSHG